MGIKHTTQTAIADDPAYDVGANEWNADHSITSDWSMSGYNIQFSTGTGIKDENGIYQLSFTTTASAVNYITISNVTTGNKPTIAAAGSDADVALRFENKGAGGGMEFSLGTQDYAGVSFSNTSSGVGGPQFLIFHNQFGSAATNDNVGILVFSAWDASNNYRNYGRMLVDIVDATAATAKGAFSFWTLVNGSEAVQMIFSNGVSVGSTNLAPGPGILAHPAGGAILHTGVAFASRPTAVAGMVIYVTDSNTATWGATVAGGGANKVLAWYNGTNWTVVGS